MLYYLFNYLNQHNVPGAGVFNYVTFRAAAAVIIALIVSVWFGNKLAINLIIEVPEKIIVSKARVGEFKAWFTD